MRPSISTLPLRGIGTHDGWAQDLAPRSTDAIDDEDLAATELEGDVPDALRGQIIDAQPDRAVRAARLAALLERLAADHRGDDPPYVISSPDQLRDEA